MRQFRNSLFLLFTSSIFSLIIIELFCRLVIDDGMHYHLEMWKYAINLKQISKNPEIGHQHLPNKKIRLMGVDVETNNFGLRDDWIDKYPQEDVIRILMLGDSVTFGWGVESDKTISKRLENSLSLNLNRKVEVINAGVGNYNTSMQVEWFETVGLLFSPDIVLLNFFINDAEPTPVYKEISFLDKYLYSKVIFLAGVDSAKRKFFGDKNWENYYRSLYSIDSSGWLDLKKSFLSIVEICKINDLPLIVLDYPEMRRLNPYAFEDISKKIERLSVANSVDYISLLPAIVSERPENLWVSVPDPHPNGYANKLISDFLTNELSQNSSIKYLLRK